MILTRSPYYKNIPWLKPSDGIKADKYTLELWIWTGDRVTNIPNEATYRIKKDNIEDSSDIDKVDIARLIEDYIDNTLIDVTTTGVNDGNCAVWVRHLVYYTTDTNISLELDITEAATKGYGYGYEGENYSSPMALLTDSIEIDAERESVVFVPINREQVSEPITILSYPNGVLNESYTLSQTDESSEVISIVSVACSDAQIDEYIQVTHGDETFSIFLREECKYNKHDVQFINRYGASQTLTFFKQRTDEMSTTGSDYESSDGQPIFGNHQFKKYNVNGKTKFTLESGYIEEGSNDLIKQLILSERVWVDGLPVNCSTESVTFKNRVNDRVVNYSMNFDYAFNEINTI